MRGFASAFLILILMFGGFSATAYAVDCSKDTPSDKIENFFGTFGKRGKEKEQILAKLKADRMLVCAKHEAWKADKDIRKINSDMKKKFGF